LLVIALLFAMFSSFMPFMEKFGDAVEYNTAYYGALSAVERGALVLRYRGPGFDGESGWIYSGTNINTGNQADEYLPEFYTYGAGATDMYRKIRSRTTEIPFVGEGNVEKIFMYLAENYPDFALIYNDKNSRLLSSLIITTDDKILYSHDLRKKSLDDGSEIKFFSPYEGG